MISSFRNVLLLLVSAASADLFAWYTPPHQQMTRAAVESLPPAMRATLGAEADPLILVNCMFPDRYRALGNVDPKKEPKPDPKLRAAMKVYCEMPDGRPIHNVTQRREDDIAALEFLLNAIIAEVRRRDTVAAAKYMGTLAHLLEDSVSPAHAGKLPDVVAELRKLQPLPKSPWEGRLDDQGRPLTAGNLHAAMELTTPPFTLDGRKPIRQGDSVTNAAPKILDRCYAIVAENRADLLEMVRATYADDVAVMDGLRARAARKGAELLADAYYTALSLADQKSTP